MRRLAGIRTAGGLEIRRNELLAPHTSFGIGGRADYFIRVSSIRRLCQVLGAVSRGRLRSIVIGGGTNLLFSDKGFRGVVVKLCGRLSSVRTRPGQAVCGGGARLAALTARAREAGLSGAEFLTGIPGTVGGAVKGNAGAWGRAIGDIVENVTVMKKSGRVASLTPDQAGFTYRASRISDDEVITSVVLRLAPGGKEAIGKRMRKYMMQRKARQPGGRSAGSFFKNPPGNPAGRLIEECGLKGAKVGRAVVSRKHGNFIINRGGARAEDVLELARKIGRAVYRKTGIRLRPEVRIVR